MDVVILVFIVDICPKFSFYATFDIVFMLVNKLILQRKAGIRKSQIVIKETSYNIQLNLNKLDSTKKELKLL